jgi:hypothetical protein
MMTAAPANLSTAPTAIDRRTVVAGLAALLACSNAARGATTESWTLATQIVTGTRIADPTVLQLAVEAIEAQFGAPIVDKLLDAVLARDAANIVKPFDDAKVEAAARRFVEIAYTGEIRPGTALGFHQALAWQVLPFTKPPSVCGPGFGWWTNPPESR